MIDFLRALRAHAAYGRRRLGFIPALVVTEMFYKFHSFTLECLAFLATWFVIDVVISSVNQWFKRHGAVSPGGRWFDGYQVLSDEALRSFVKRAPGFVAPLDRVERRDRGIGRIDLTRARGHVEQLERQRCDERRGQRVSTCESGKPVGTRKKVP